VEVAFPERITLVDDSGSILTHARVIADQQIVNYDETQQRKIRRGVS
jgi:hypothetical protein